MKQVFYLKVSTDNFFTMTCIQFWLDVAYEHKAHIYIICEKTNLIKQMKENLHFGNQLLDEYSQTRDKKKDDVFFCAYFDELTYLAKEIASKRWIKACVSHLSTFYHAKKNNIKYFWNIDADDTLFYQSPIQISKAFNAIENIVPLNNIDVISYDMWNSQSNRQHWSFGICYSNNIKDYISIIQQNTNSLIHDFDLFSIDKNMYGNIDWCFTFLNKRNLINAKSFYIENAFFVHFGFAFLSSNYHPKPGSIITFWNEGYMYHIFESDSDDFSPKNIDIVNNIKIDIDISPNKKMEEYKKQPANNKKTKTLKMKVASFIKHFIIFGFFYVSAKFFKHEKVINNLSKEHDILLNL